MPRPSKTDTECRRVRLVLGLTQNQFAEDLGVSASLINRIECGQIEPSTRMQEMIFLSSSNDVHKNAKKLIARYATKIYSVANRLYEKRRTEGRIRS